MKTILVSAVGILLGVSGVSRATWRRRPLRSIGKRQRQGVARSSASLNPPLARCRLASRKRPSPTSQTYTLAEVTRFDEEWHVVIAYEKVRSH